MRSQVRSLEIGRSGLGGDGKPWRIGTVVHGARDILPRVVINHSNNCLELADRVQQVTLNKPETVHSATEESGYKPVSRPCFCS